MNVEVEREKTVGTVDATSGAQGIGFAPLPRKSVRRTSAEPDGPDASAAMDRGGMSQSKAEAALPEIRAAVGNPDLNLVDVDNVLEGLVSTCYYLNWDRNRYRFGLSPNLNQILVTRRGAVQPKEIAERIKKETQELFNKGTKALDRRFFPERSNDVPNRPVLTLVPLGLDYSVGEKATDKLMETIVRDCGNSGRTYKSWRRGRQCQNITTR